MNSLSTKCNIYMDTTVLQKGGTEPYQWRASRSIGLVSPPTASLSHCLCVVVFGGDLITSILAIASVGFVL